MIRLAVGDPAGLDFDEIFEIRRDLEALLPTMGGLAINNSCKKDRKMADMFI